MNYARLMLITNFHPGIVGGLSLTVLLLFPFFIFLSVRRISYPGFHFAVAKWCKIKQIIFLLLLC